MKRILTCVGTRPNFIKVMRLRELLNRSGFEYKLLHTGQHFDDNMSKVFFEQLKLGKPDFYLGIGGGTNNEIVGKIIKKMDSVFAKYKPDLVIVPGDVNSTFSCAFAAASHNIPVAHIESGLRSFDRTMPEERNRILTDHLSDLLCVTEPVGVQQLFKEGIDESKIVLVGNTIVDALLQMMPMVNKSKVLDQIGIKEKYCLVTFHRPVNVDSLHSLKKVVEVLKGISKMMKVVFPIHPRTLGKLRSRKLLRELSDENILLTEPQGYIDFLKLVKESACVISDSGGVQIETSFLRVPCFTVRKTTELKITVEKGTNTLVELEPQVIIEMVAKQTVKHVKKKLTETELWDGKASERIVQAIKDYCR